MRHTHTYSIDSSVSLVNRLRTIVGNWAWTLIHAMEDRNA